MYLRVSEPCVSLMAKLGLTPNQVTIANHVMTLTLGVWWFSRGTSLGYLLGLSVMLVNGFLDYIDGDLAKKTGKCSSLGAWLDTGFDVMIQTIVMGSIALGCYKQGMNIMWILFLFIGIVGSNLVTEQLNNKFGFNSHSGNNMFQKYMNLKPTLVNRFFKNIVDPTASPVGLIFFTLRYFITIGALFNIMPKCFIVMVFITNFRWSFLYVIYAMHLQKYEKLWLSQALAIIDEQREEFYKIREVA